MENNPMRKIYESRQGMTSLEKYQLELLSGFCVEITIIMSIKKILKFKF